MTSESLPCIVCRTQMERVEHDGYELQPNHGLHFSTYGAYGTTVFDPMDGSTLDVVICDECITKAGHEGIVRMSQPRIEIQMEDGVPAGFYSPGREEVVWAPDEIYPREPPLVIEFEEVGKPIHPKVMWHGYAMPRAAAEIERLAAEEGAS